MKKDIAKKLITLFVMCALILSTTAFAYADTDCNSYNEDGKYLLDEETNNRGDDTNGWSNWTVNTVYYSSKYLENLTSSFLWSILTWNLQGTANNIANVISIIMDSANQGDNVYYKTTVYQRTDGTGRIQFYSVRVVYKYAYYNILGTITTDPVTYNSTVKSIPDGNE